ncbi:threonine-phosphate decarboxylase CobD [Xanthomonas maliensis]|uniref:threonine-phosphate decarboxylase CobD n=1 Tax=Xanthomonas maliensis TaxID=1321368 RepID=UPI0003A70C7E|nr:threonine-phosphate decarboxylase CobD [Xanthomonas maliensis]KAB7772292.1 threonine-phosphate decarboxylase [Xanthomonas maliensis]
MLEHGGRLRRAAHTYGRPVAQWLDLSTGVSPFGWPVPPVPPEAWLRLPEDDDGLSAIAADYYGAAHLLPVAGSQAAIQALPLLRAPAKVGVLTPGYAEHAHGWRRAGHDVRPLAADAVPQAAGELDVVVLIHPNNPTGARFAIDHLLALHAQLVDRGGWLVVDEAFIDATPEHSLCPHAGVEGLVVLRSVGKFFGLAGARAGVVCAWPSLLQALHAQLGPWTLSGPTRWVLRQALADRDWQAQARPRLHAAAQRLAYLLQAQGLTPTAGTAFFQWCQRADAAALHHALAQHGILTRLFATPSSLRIGLPADAVGEARLAAALTEVMA